MKYKQNITREPSKKVYRINRHGLDRIRKQLDRIRSEQAKIYSHFKKKYNKHQIDNIMSKQEMRELLNGEQEISAISNDLIRADRFTSRRLTY